MKDELADRIKKARREVGAYPSWVRDNNKFQGGQKSQYRAVGVEKPNEGRQSGFGSADDVKK